MHNKQIPSQGKMDFPHAPNQGIEISILKFLTDSLTVYQNVHAINNTRSDEQQQKEDKRLEKEDDISYDLCRFLNPRTQEFIVMPTPKKGADLLIRFRLYAPDSKVLFVVEAKRLPPTNSKDYVEGRTGGIDRFK